MRIEFTPNGWADFLYWLDADLGKAQRIRELLVQCQRHPFTGTGKPEPLKGALKGCWSRRIDDEHRLVYAVSGSGENQRLSIIQCRYHYDR